MPGKEKIFKDLAEMQLGEIVVGKAPATYMYAHFAFSNDFANLRARPYSVLS